ncbi:hypothetical protein MRX96_057011 [Rhipicephalus microplus]
MGEPTQAPSAIMSVGRPSVASMESGTSRDNRVTSPDFMSDDTCETFIAGPGLATRLNSRDGGAPSGAPLTGGSIQAA